SSIAYAAASPTSSERRGRAACGRRAVSAKRWLIALGCALSAALLGAVLWRLDWNEFIAGLKDLRHAWLAGVFALTVASVVVRTARWRLAAGAATTSWRAFWNANVAGLLLNQIYPLRAGEIFRMFAIAHLAQVALGRAAMSALVDRLADVVVLG